MTCSKNPLHGIVALRDIVNGEPTPNPKGIQDGRFESRPEA
jgi:hypothetical protein